MEDCIGKALTATVSGISPVYLYEAETDEYPYAVYYYTPEFSSTKDGVYKIAADVTLQVYSDSFDEAYALAGEIREALLSGMNGAAFMTRVSTMTRECVEGVWNIETVYKITQIDQWQQN